MGMVVNSFWLGSTPPPAGIALVNVGTPVYPTSTATASPGYPAGLANGDIGILTVLCTDNLSSPGSQTVSTPAGWTLFHTAPQAVIPSIVTSYGAQFWKRLDGTESGTVTVNVSEGVGTGHVAAVIEAFRGCLASGTPLESGGHSVAGDNTTQTGSTPTTGQAASMILTHFLTGNSSTTGTPNGSAVELFEAVAVAGVDLAVNFGGYSLEQASAGAGTAISRTMAVAAGYVQITCVLIPA